MNMNKIPVAALLFIVIMAPTTLANHPSPDHDLSWGTQIKAFSTQIGTQQGVAYAGGWYYVSATNALARYTDSGFQDWMTDTSTDASTGDSNNDITTYNNRIYVGQKSGNSAYVAWYEASTGGFQGEVLIGTTGTVSALTYHDAAFWIVWADSSVSPATYTIRKYDPAWNLQESYAVPQTYATNTGPQGAAWHDQFLLLPRHAADGDFGVDVFRYDQFDNALAYHARIDYASWNAGNRTEIGSQGLDVFYAAGTWQVAFAGRDATTGNGDGYGSIGIFPIEDQRSQSYLASTFGSIQSTFDTQNGTLQGVTGDGTFLYTSHTNALSKFDASGNHITTRATTGDIPGTQQGGLQYYNGHLYVSVSNYPANPRQQTVAIYNATNLGFIESRNLGNQDGSGGGFGFYQGHIWSPVKVNLGQQLVFRRVNPDTLNIVQDVAVGNFGDFSPQGISFLGNRAYVPHFQREDPDNLDGIYIFETHDQGASWGFLGTEPYPSWDGTPGPREYATQGMHFHVDSSCNSAIAYFVGRDADGNGNGRGDLARITVNTAPPSGYCPGGVNPNPYPPDDEPDDPDPNDNTTTPPLGPGGGNVEFPDNTILLVAFGVILALGLAYAVRRHAHDSVLKIKAKRALLRRPSPTMVPALYMALAVAAALLYIYRDQIAAALLPL